MLSQLVQAIFLVHKAGLTDLDHMHLVDYAIHISQPHPGTEPNPDEHWDLKSILMVTRGAPLLQKRKGFGKPNKNIPEQIQAKYV